MTRYPITPSQVSLTVLALAALICLPSQPAGESFTQMIDKYQPVRACSVCHQRIHKEYESSPHAKSFSNSVFRNIYLRDIIAGMEAADTIHDEGRDCLRCHAPMAVASNPVLTVGALRNTADPDITCDFCHTISGFHGDTPGDANYVSQPGIDKFGPFEVEKFHRNYSPLHTKSTFCALCHDSKDSAGAQVRSTYQEWAASVYPQHGIECQHCHMSARGYLRKGQSVFISGKASEMTMGNVPVRRQLHSHTFPGGTTARQLVKSVAIKIVPGGQAAAPGEIVQFEVFLRNRRAGHNVPGGGNGLRMMWLDVRATNPEGSVIAVAKTTHNKNFYDVSGIDEFDRSVWGDELPPYSRTYRRVFGNGRGEQVLLAHEAREILFDNRLEPRTTRREVYAVGIPDNYTAETLLLTAELYYLRYPASFASGANLSEAKPVLVASAQDDFRVRSRRLTKRNP